MLLQALCPIRSHLWMETLITVRKRPYAVKNGDFFVPRDLEIDNWLWKTTGHIYIATLNFSWIQTEVTVPKYPNLDKICFVMCDLDLWHAILHRHPFGR